MPSPEASTLTLAPSSRETSDSFWSVVRNIRKHWPIVVATTVFSVGTALAYTKSATKIYQASTMLEIDPNPIQPLKDNTFDTDMGVGSFWNTQEYYATQYKIIVSNRVLGKVVSELGLARDRDFMGPPDPDVRDEVAAATKRLSNAVVVEAVKNSRLVWIRTEDRDPARAQRVSNAIAAAYIAENLDTSVSASADAVVWLGGQVDHIKQELEHDEDALHGFKRDNDLPSTSINEVSNMLRVEMQELDTALTQTRTKRAEVAARSEELSKVSSESPDELPASELLASPYLQALRKDYQESEKERAGLLAEGKGENHPDVKLATVKAAQAKQALLAEVRNIHGAAAHDLAIISRQEQTESGLFDATRRRAVDLTMKEIEYHRLDRTREQDEKLYSMLLERLKEADLARMMRVNNVRVVDPAAEPDDPVRPRKALALPIGAIVGLLVGLALAMLREQLDSSLKVPGDVEQRLGITFLGLLPLNDRPAVRTRRSRRKPAEGNANMDLAVHEKPLGGIAEAARSIRTNLMFMNPDKPYKTILVTSAAPGEGKTTVACSIAIAFAQGGQRVCIVDCDLRRPRLHRIFGREGDPGITNLLMSEATIDEVAKPTVVPNLSLVPAGALPPNPADLFHSVRFKRALEELRERFDRIIVDSPPVVAVTDAAIISTLTDGSVFVVRGFRTPRNLAAQGLRSLIDVDANVIGAVLNAVNLSSNEYSYYYHYQYFKRDGYREAAPGTRAEGAPPPN